MEILHQILEKIRAYDRILIFRHKRLDGDCVGASKGLKAILQLTFPEKEILIPDTQVSNYLAFLGPDDGEIPEEKYADALGIVVDTATSDRISNPNFRLCKELIKIDHHIPVEDYADLAWVEEERSSACELITAFYEGLRSQLKLDKEGATYLYAGMVTDSGRFQFRSVSGDTHRLAGLLLDFQVDTDTLFARLYMRTFDELRFKAHVYQNMEVTENGVAYIYVSRAMKKQFGLTNEAASSCVSFLENIEGCLCWLAFIENDEPDSAIRVRLRSRFVPVNTIAERYHGGGHACACGATVYDRQEVYSLIRETDAHIKQFKETHEGWL
jgi:phosphoesterase RecJ-like protein